MLHMFKTIREIIASGYAGGAQGRQLSGRYEDSLRKIKKAISIHPDGESELLFMSCLGQAYMYLEEYEKAIPILSDTLQKMSEEEEIWSGKNLSEAYIQVDKALEYCQKKLELINKRSNAT